jgi:hypothetical protein
MSRTWLWHVASLGVYILLALLLTWPLAAHLTTHVVGDGIDDPALAWNLWHLKSQLVDRLQLDIFRTGWMFHPIGINLAFYTLTPLNGLASIPLQLAWGLVPANNLVFLSSFVLAGYGAFLLVLDQLRLWHAISASGRPYVPPGAPSLTNGESALYVVAAAAGVVYAFASSKLFYAALGQFNIASSQWVPFGVLYLLRMARPGPWRERLHSAGFAALFLLAQAWAELTFASFLLLWMGLLLLWQLVRVGRRPSWRGWLHAAGGEVWPFVVVAALFVAGMLPFLAAMLPDLRAEGDFFGQGGGFADVFSADLMGYLVPTRLHPLLGAWTATLPFPNDKGQHIFAGYTALALTAVGLWWLCRWRATRAWGWLWGLSALLFWLLTLGPQVRWAGQDLPIPGPFALVSRLPFFSGNRYPSRYSVMLMLAAAVLVGAGLAWLWDAARRRNVQRRPAALVAAICAAFTLLFLAEHVATPLPLSDFRVPPIYERLAQEPGDFAVLELPTGWRNGARVLGRSDVLIMMQQWYQTAHGKRRLGGNTSRNPEYKFQYFTAAPLLGDLIALINADRPHLAAEIEARWDELAARARALAPIVLRELGVRYVLVHVEKSPPALLRFVAEALPVGLLDEWQGADWTGAPSTIRLYQVVDSATDPTDQSLNPSRTIDLAGPLAPLYLGEGWSTLSAAGARQAVRATPALLLDLPAAGSTVRLAGSRLQNLNRATINGIPALVEQRSGDQAVLAVPAGAADQPVDRVELQFTGTPEPAVTVVTPPTGQGWPIGATGSFLAPAAAVVVRSAGEEVGDFAHIYVNGVDVAPNQRGYNLVALDAAGAVLDTAVFDVLGDPRASAALATWLARWPAGTIVAGAVADEASVNLGQDAVDALRAAGVAGDLRNRFRTSHAFVGVVGAAPGTAAEAMSLLEPATIAVGSPVDAPVVYGALREITVEPR